jgi:hypothetical protein
MAAQLRRPSFARLSGENCAVTGNVDDSGVDVRQNGTIVTVTRMWRAMQTAAMVLLAVEVTGGARAQTLNAASEPRAVASNGAVVVMPELAGLDCAGMSYVLRRIDLSSYRSPAAFPKVEPDIQIFEYEDRLAAQYYHSCIMVGNKLEDPADAFSFGFDEQ